MKKITSAEALEISQAIRAILNRHEGTAGCDAVVLCFAGDVDGMKLAHIKVGDPPELLDTITHLVNYMALHAYNCGTADGLERAHNIMNAPTINEPSKV